MVEYRRRNGTASDNDKDNGDDDDDDDDADDDDDDDDDSGVWAVGQPLKDCLPKTSSNTSNGNAMAD
eukprot:CAMPEP_0180596988 /NCGR_PEP_ID=MMETSP1037_2-20121125/22099_1 /TAXON_ID=632150 /ORGANISM="Azadinium spinosum, Strain 3D9" /LENGTH=66 /DNA_ID=CAMNT_0022615515 /DNA_START=241 /DNA_END=439 /DNA_ORIENTATION=+